MANNTHRYGFRWAGPWMGPNMPQPVERTIADAYDPDVDATGTTIGLSIGDPVKLVSDGTVALANLGNAIWGVIVGFKPYWDGTAMRSTSYIPNATTGGSVLERKTRALVVPVLQAIWEIDVDDNTTATTEAAYLALIEENVDHNILGNTTNSSKPTADPRLDISTHGTATAGWRIVGISKTADNQDFSGTNVKLLVVCNEPQMAGLPIATGV